MIRISSRLRARCVASALLAASVAVSPILTTPAHAIIVYDPTNRSTYLVTCQPQEGRASSTSNVIVEITPTESE